MRDPFEGVEKPDPLWHEMAGCWSRRIDDEHRLVYLVDGDDLVILQARYHLSVPVRHSPGAPEHNHGSFVTVAKRSGGKFSPTRRYGKSEASIAVDS